MKTTLLKLIPKRSNKGNKSDYGRALLIAGSKDMMGAAVLCSKAASRIGAGYTLLLTDRAHFNFYKNPDFIVYDYKKHSISSIKFSAVAMGCGMGTGKASLKLLRELVKLAPKKVVLDADALNLLAQNKKIKIPHKSWILTPHEAELARLLGVPAVQVKKKRSFYAQQAAKKFQCIVLLKGNPSYVSLADGKSYSLKAGNAALSKAGTGDVLTGIICGLLAQGLDSVDAAKLGTYVHGYCSQVWVQKKDKKGKRDIASLMASDIPELIPYALSKLRAYSNHS